MKLKNNLKDQKYNLTFLFRIVIVMNITCNHSLFFFFPLPFANAIWCIVPEGVGTVSAEGAD